MTMYLTLDQVLLVSDKQPQEGDTVVYERQLGSQRILTPDDAPSRHASEPKRYGVLYYDANETPCVIPDVFSMDDAMVAKSWR